MSLGRRDFDDTRVKKKRRRGIRDGAMFNAWAGSARRATPGRQRFRGDAARAVHIELDAGYLGGDGAGTAAAAAVAGGEHQRRARLELALLAEGDDGAALGLDRHVGLRIRSEERRVGKECRSRWAT